MPPSHEHPRNDGVAKVPAVMQMEALECGAASLAMILAYYGLWVPLAQLREDSGVSRDGAKASNILTAAEKYGMVAKGYRYGIENLRKNASYPCIIHWNFNHFVVLMVLYLLVMLRYNVALTALAMSAAAINLLVSQRMAREKINVTRGQMQANGKLYGTTLAGIEMIETIKASGAENGFFERWAGYQAKVIGGNQKFVKLESGLGIVPELVSSLANALVLILGVYLVLQGSFSLGLILAFQGLLLGFMTPANSIIKTTQKIQEMRTNMERIQDIMEYPTDVVFDGSDAPRTDVAREKLSGDVLLENVTFGYSRLEPPLIENLTLHIRPGEKIAFVGASGCGKSTITKLISGLYQPWSGRILFDGKPLSDIDRGTFTGSVAVVEQDIALFEDTIAGNIRMWDKSIEDYDVILAARDAQIHDDIMARNGGYDYRIAEGGRDLSGGQRQRLEIARVLSQDPTIIMDEATSALDSKTEFFRQFSSGELASRATGINTYCDTVIDTFLFAVPSFLLTMLYLLYLAYIAQDLVPFVLVEVAITLAFSIACLRAKKRNLTEKLAASSKTSGVSHTMITGIQKIRIAGAEKRAFAKWSSSYQRSAEIAYNPPAIAKASPFIPKVIPLFFCVVYYSVAAQSVSNGMQSISGGEYYTFTLLYGALNVSLVALFSQLMKLAESSAAFELAKPIFEAIPEVSENKKPITKLSGGIEVSHASFRYDKDMPYLFRDLSIKINPGEYVTVVGKSGCGKSTLLRLLLGFESPEKGAVYYDGQDLSKIDLESLRRRIGTVMQGGKLFLGDIYYNIIISAPWLTVDDAWEAAETAGIDDGRIAEEGTYDELIGQGGIFSDLVSRQQLDAVPAQAGHEAGT